MLVQINLRVLRSHFLEAEYQTGGMVDMWIYSVPTVRTPHARVLLHTRDRRFLVTNIPLLCTSTFWSSGP